MIVSQSLERKLEIGHVLEPLAWIFPEAVFHQSLQPFRYAGRDVSHPLGFVTQDRRKD